MSVNSRLTATKIICQRKAFYRHRIPEPSSARKETIDIGILVKSRNGDWKIMQSIRITKTFLENKELETVQPVQMNTYQSYTYRKDLSWLHFDDMTMVQDRQQLKDQQSCISIFVAYPTIPSSN